MTARLADSYDATPYSYANHLARYIKDPATIRAHTKTNFGRSPPIDIITDMIAGHAKIVNVERYHREPYEDDGLPFKPRSLVGTEPPPRPKLPPYTGPIEVKVEPAKPIDHTPIVTARDLIGAIAAEFGFDLAGMIGTSRRRSIMLARRTAMYVLHKRGNSYPLIGRFISRDHATVIHAVREFERCATDQMRAIAAKFIPVDRT